MTLDLALLLRNAINTMWRGFARHDPPVQRS